MQKLLSVIRNMEIIMPFKLWNVMQRLQTSGNCEFVNCCKNI